MAKLLQSFPHIGMKEYSTVSAAILPTEARHSAFLDGPVSKRNPWSTSLEVHTSLMQAHSRH